jgi:hypothetical protein
VIDRRQRIRRYKETPRTMGVFRVRNVAAGRSFVGFSVDLPSMLNRQRFQLESGGHPDRALQADWDAVRGAGFEFEVLDTLEALPESERDPAEDLEALRDIWVERLSADGELLYSKRSP